MKPRSLVTCLLAANVLLGCSAETDCQDAAALRKPIRVFVLAGDELVLEQGVVAGRTSGVHQDFYPAKAPKKDEKKKHVHASVYKGAYDPKTDYDKLTPVATALVEVGDPRTRRIHPKKRGREPVPMAPFPDAAREAGHTTVLRGAISVRQAGKYEFHPGSGEAAFNITTVEGKEVYRREPGAEQAAVTPLQLTARKRYGFQTMFFRTPGHAFRIPQVSKPGTLETASEEAKYAYLKDRQNNWVTRSDVVLYDAHPIHNNTEAPARPLSVGVKTGGPEGALRTGVHLTLGHRLGDAFDEPVMILRFGTRHPTWFLRGSRDLSHDYRSPSIGGGNLNGSWDVIHFNFGVWDATYREATSKYFSGYNTTSVEDFEKNLRTLVAKMKKTGATLIWGSVTPVWEGEPGKPNGDEDAYNRVAAKVMKEHGVIINDLNAETRRLGFPKSNNVHSVGNLEPKVTATILKVLEERKNKTKPLPRVLLIGDSITGSYQKGVFKSLDGKAAVFKNPGNAEDTWNGLERMDEWLDLKRYLLNGQEYLELVDGVKKVMGEELERAYPGYAGQGAELAGLIWFQGIADGGSAVKAAAYEKHLAALIRDLRKELNAPELPVVVAALARSGRMNNNQKTVFDAQMRIGNREAYPEFAGNAVSVDTTPFCKPPAQSPGGREPYAGNALSYLEIGDAMAEAMLKLLNTK